MGSALWIGSTGLNSSSMQIDVIGNNLANSNTPGYKADNMFFSSLMNKSLASGGSSLSVGQGVRATGMQTQFGAGAMQTTGNATDLAIDGDGFFSVKDGTGAEYFTRAGAFHTDKNNNLVDANGYSVQGFNPIENTITGVGFGTPISGASPTGSITAAGFNLDSDIAAGGTFGISQSIYDSLGGAHAMAVNFSKSEKLGYWGVESTLDDTNYAQIAGGLGRVDGFVFGADGSLDGMYKVTDLTATPGGAGAGTVTLGDVHYGKLYQETTAPITLTFDDTTNTWSTTAAGGYSDMTLDYTAGTGKGNGTITLRIGGSDQAITLNTAKAANADWTDATTIAFNNITYGAPTAVQNLAIQFDDLPDDPVYVGGSGTDKNAVKWDMASTDVDISGITSFASASETRAFSVDGWTVGTLKRFSFESDGKITGYFTNGQTKTLGQLQLAQFTNPVGLKKVGNYFTSTELSGTPTRNFASLGGLGDIRANTLEISNTDLTAEFINMMTAQRAYQANARVISADDQNFQQLINIKR